MLLVIQTYSMQCSYKETAPVNISLTRPAEHDRVRPDTNKCLVSLREGLILGLGVALAFQIIHQVSKYLATTPLIGQFTGRYANCRCKTGAEKKETHVDAILYE